MMRQWIWLKVRLEMRLRWEPMWAPSPPPSLAFGWRGGRAGAGKRLLVELVCSIPASARVPMLLMTGVAFILVGLVAGAGWLLLAWHLQRGAQLPQPPSRELWQGGALLQVVLPVVAALVRLWGWLWAEWQH